MQALTDTAMRGCLLPANDFLANILKVVGMIALHGMIVVLAWGCERETDPLGVWYVLAHSVYLKVLAPPLGALRVEQLPVECLSCSV